MSTKHNPNLPAVVRAASRYGAVVDRVIHGRHMAVDLIAADGHLVRLRLSKGKVDPRKIDGWIRQKINRAQRPETIRRNQ